MTQYTIDNNGDAPGDTVPHLLTVPVDGTTLGSDNGGIYKVGGGAPLYINSCDVGCGTPVDVTQYTIDNNGDAPGDTVPHLLTVPVDGTTLGSDNGGIYKVGGGARSTSIVVTWGVARRWM